MQSFEHKTGNICSNEFHFNDFFNLRGVVAGGRQAVIAVALHSQFKRMLCKTNKSS